ncbi:DUF4399 domain-containing protein [Enterovibrio norvegicus]|uniref:DUF4399 domain-containing protein n=1 Tax=Enterovibrio norvegicus DSM 15893 TaxID=1121869 RepID=A0A1I5KPM0_9GAMM|nr:DUF4399 domain-containing protein [Enterovibrio norvegicus]SFO87014.1 protein of unknown function [Enterovibrio norvegicus DSM 15893]
MNAVFAVPSRLLVYLVIFSALPFSECLAASAPENANVYFIAPTDGDIVSRQFDVKVGVKQGSITPVGEAGPNLGHCHVLINLDDLVDLSMPLPVNANIVHLDGGESDVSLTLPRGKHTLQLLLGDDKHVPHSPPIFSQPITITVR